MTISIIGLHLTLKNKIKPAIMLTIILGILLIIEMWIMLSHGLITFDDNVIPIN